MKKQLLSLGMVLAVSGVAIADNNDSATVDVTGTLVNSLSLTKNTDLTMAALVLPDTGDTVSVTAACAADGSMNSTYDNQGGNPYASGDPTETSLNSAFSENTNVLASPNNCARLTVAGESGLHYATNPTVSVATHASAPGLELSTPTCVANTDGEMKLTGGSDEIYCGATVTVTDASAAVAGAYSGLAFTVAVVYD